MKVAKAQTAARKVMCVVGGYMCFGFGIAGIMLPLLPTTIFWILSVWLFARAHPEMVDRIYRWPRLGAVVHDFAEDGAIGDKAKVSASLGILGVGGISLWLAGPSILWTTIICIILLSVITYIVSRPIPE